MEVAVIPIERALDFIMGGNSHFTVVAPNSERFTFKVLHCEPDNKPEYYRVSVLTGPDNVNNYRRIAEIHVIDGMPKIVCTGNDSKTPSFRMIEKVYYNLIFTQYEPLSGYEFWHTGRCGRCGRLLTVPSSIEKGIGPECESKINAFISQYVEL